MRRIAAAAVEFGAEAEGGAVRLHNRRLGGVLGRLEGRSSILGHYSAPDAVGAFRLGGCRESGWSAVRLYHSVSREGTCSASSTAQVCPGFRASAAHRGPRVCPLHPRPKKPPRALAHPISARHSTLPLLCLRSAHSLDGGSCAGTRSRRRRKTPKLPPVAARDRCCVRLGAMLAFDETAPPRCWMRTAPRTPHPGPQIARWM